MRIRLPIAGVFILGLVLAGWLGFSNTQLPHDKFLHFIVFFVLTLLFYWSIDAPRKRAVNLAVLVCGLGGGIGSEFAQNALTERVFDYRDIAANFVGSLFATVLSSWYHGRLTERRRKARYDRLRQNLDDTEAQQPAPVDPVELTALAPEAEAEATPAPTQTPPE